MSDLYKAYKRLQKLGAYAYQTEKCIYDAVSAEKGLSEDGAKKLAVAFSTARAMHSIVNDSLDLFAKLPDAIVEIGKRKGYTPEMAKETMERYFEDMMAEHNRNMEELTNGAIETLKGMREDFKNDYRIKKWDDIESRRRAKGEKSLAYNHAVKNDELVADYYAEGGHITEKLAEKYAALGMSKRGIHNRLISIGVIVPNKRKKED